MRIYSFACSDVGRKRAKNEDSYLLAPDTKLFAVADGMGGHRGGAVASHTAVHTLDEHVRKHRHLFDSSAPSLDVDASPALVLAASVREANARIHARGRGDPDLAGMGTTTTGLLFSGNAAFIAHVGDSRVYLVRGDRILQLSEDHSVVYQQVKAGLITEEQAKNSPYRSVILRSVGVEAEVDIDLIRVEVCSGDTFLLCSDGLTNLVADDEINRIVNDNWLHRVPEILVDLANERGGTDNVTVVLAYALDERELAAPLGA